MQYIEWLYIVVSVPISLSYECNNLFLYHVNIQIITIKRATHGRCPPSAAKNKGVFLSVSAEIIKQVVTTYLVHCSEKELNDVPYISNCMLIIVLFNITYMHS